MVASSSIAPNFRQLVCHHWMLSTYDLAPDGLRCEALLEAPAKARRRSARKAPALSCFQPKSEPNPRIPDSRTPTDYQAMQLLKRTWSQLRRDFPTVRPGSRRTCVDADVPT
jgi:hypothetical protein